MDQVCERTFECQPEAVRATELFQNVFGTSVDDCKARLYANPTAPMGRQGVACDDVENDAQLCANLGEPGATTFDVGRARECRDARDDLSCEDYLAQLTDPSLAPAACAQRCR